MTLSEEQPRYSQIAVTMAIAYLLAGALLFSAGRRDYPALHTILDTGTQLLSGVLAWLLWEIGRQVGRPLPKAIAVSFGVTSAAELLHTLVDVEWSGVLGWVARSENQLRPTTWPVAAYLLPAGLLLVIWRARKRWNNLLILLGLAALGVLLLFLFYRLPRYAPPGFLGMTRPTLALIPVLWLFVGGLAWKRRSEDSVLPFLVPAAAILVLAHTSMLYSQAPHDTPAMGAHLGKLAAYLGLLLALMKMASFEMAGRIRAQEALARMNEELESRVRERTGELRSANESLQGEIAVRREAEMRVQAQVGRLNLLHHITRAIGERQDLRSIFQVIVRRLEADLPVDFCCVCLYDRAANELEVTVAGPKSEVFGIELASDNPPRFAVDENGLSRCIGGELIYEPEIRSLRSPFLQWLARAGFRSLVAAPLQADSKPFGLLVAAQQREDAFSSGACEFLLQLSDHAGLAAHQARLYSTMRQAYDDLRQAQETLLQQERLRALGQMASGIAHDINNALSPISLYSELLGREAGLSERAVAHVHTIQRAVSDVGQTIGRLKEFSRSREGKLGLTPVELNPLLTQVIDLTRARWSDIPLQHGVVINIVTALAEELPPVMGVESEIREALINLVFNAVDAMPDGGTLTLRTSQGLAHSTGLQPLPEVHLEVGDTGTGMDEETRRRCMEPFFTTKGKRGTGLGLAMVYGIAERHDAVVAIDSREGKGTFVRVTFPAAADPPSQKPPVTEKPVLGQLRILVIDDDALVLAALQDSLEAIGHCITIANGGADGVESFSRSRSAGELFDVVITDLGMPNMDGRQVAAAIKAISPTTPVIMLTGWGQQLTAGGKTPPHVDCLLAKPPGLTQLHDALLQLTKPITNP